MSTVKKRKGNFKTVLLWVPPTKTPKNFLRSRMEHRTAENYSPPSGVEPQKKYYLQKIQEKKKKKEKGLESDRPDPWNGIEPVCGTNEDSGCCMWWWCLSLSIVLSFRGLRHSITKSACLRPLLCAPNLHVYVSTLWIPLFTFSLISLSLSLKSKQARESR